MAHTPAPWTVNVTTVYCVYQDERIRCTIVSTVDPFGPCCVAHIDNVANEDDAHLIAAAPDLLLACRMALNDRRFDDWPEIAPYLIAAIAKAEGR